MASSARKMVNLNIDETSGVDHPAHLSEGWLVIKSADGTDVEDVLDSVLTEEGAEMAPDKTTATEGDVQESDELAIAKSKIADLEAQLAEKSGEVAKSLDPSEEFLKSAPEAFVKEYEALRKQASDAEETLQKERDAQADKEAIAKAKGYDRLNLEAEKVGPALRKLATIDSDLAKSFETMLSSLNAQAESASIFAELGKSADGGSGDALGRMEGLAKALVESNVAVSMADAMTKVAEANPELYAQYDHEKKGA